MNSAQKHEPERPTTVSVLSGLLSLQILGLLGGGLVTFVQAAQRSATLSNPTLQVGILAIVVAGLLGAAVVAVGRRVHWVWAPLLVWHLIVAAITMPLIMSDVFLYALAVAVVVLAAGVVQILPSCRAWIRDEPYPPASLL